MFTGIVTHLGTVERVTPTDAGIVTFELTTSPAFEGAVVGDSIAIQGTCLTVTSLAVEGDAGRYTFDAIPETLRKTSLGGLAVGDAVNLEAALKVGDALGGHWVQGHVDGVGEVTDVRRVDGSDDVRVEIALPDVLSGDVIPKGSVTIDGVSLTVGEVERADGRMRFSVYLIPHTLDVTTLSRLAPGDRVNLEMDVLGRWVAHHLARLGIAPAPGNDGAVTD